MHRPGRLWIRIGTGSGATGSDRAGENGVRDAERPPGPADRAGARRWREEEDTWGAIAAYALKTLRNLGEIRETLGAGEKRIKRRAGAPGVVEGKGGSAPYRTPSGGRNRRKGAFRKWLARNGGEGAGKGRTLPGLFSTVPYEFLSDPLRPKYAEAVPCGDGRTR